MPLILMKKLLLPIVALASVATFVLAKNNANNDPVIMTVNGKDVPLSEFEYLYHKNNTQQTTPQTPDEYLEMFINYKLKVADAESHGLDTTKSFIDELEGHRRELARPYMSDTTVQETLIAEIYAHMDRLVDVSHVMLRKGNSPEANDSVKHLLDSLRTVIVTGQAPLEEVALRWSIDPQVRRNAGRMGWMKANVYPYTFENVAYSTPVDSVSAVMETPFGFHIIKVHGFKPNPGTVSASHIMKMARGLSEEEKAVKKAQIDSIYELVKSGDAELFAAIAQKESDDRGSAAQGGKLEWFGVGEMVPEFEKVAFELPDGSVSEPFETAYGYHIVLKHGHKGIPSYAEAREAILRNINRDDRRNMAEKVQIEKFVKKYKGSLTEKGFATVQKTVESFGVPDSAALEAVKALTKVEVAKIGKQKLFASEVAAKMAPTPGLSVRSWMEAFRSVAKRDLDDAAIELAIADLPNEHPAYRNLLREYRDGILLFDISNSNVWEKASKDQAGLEKYFEDHRTEYTWDKPRFKGVIVLAENDSVASEVRAWMEANQVAPEDMPKGVKAAFNRQAKAEKVLVAKGDNPIVDAVAFGGEQPDLSANRYTTYFVVEGKVIEQPEEAQDVRGNVSTDYQQQLEREWVKELREKYPVKVNKEVFSKVK